MSTPDALLDRAPPLPDSWEDDDEGWSNDRTTSMFTGAGDVDIVIVLVIVASSSS